MTTIDGAARSNRSIIVRGARMNNLRDVDVDIPKDRIVVFTGVSGSGKSSLVFDTVAAESRRLLNDTLPAFVQNFMPTYGQPEADRIDELSAAVVIDQGRVGGNPRSTVGTYTDTYTLLRILYARAGDPTLASAINFSFNDARGLCLECDGMGRVAAVDEDALVDASLSLAEGAITFPGYKPDSWMTRTFTESGFFDIDKPIADYTDEERHQLFHADETKIEIDTGGGTSMNLTFMGLIPKLRGGPLAKELDQLQPHIREAVERISTQRACPECHGARLNEAARSVQLGGKAIHECAALESNDLRQHLATLEVPEVQPILDGLLAKLDHLELLGLGYLSLDRPTATLSGGESQRVRLVRYLGSSLVDMTYVLDEPSTGLHPHDVHRLNRLLAALRDKGNSVLVVEHDPAIIEQADHVIDMGPGAGAAGGTVMFEGTPVALREADTVTGRHLGRARSGLRDARAWTESASITGADTHNLKQLDVEVPLGVLVAVTGVAGSGKSSLIHGHFVPGRPGAVVVDQKLSSANRRSNPATYTGMLDKIRAAFAKANGVKPGLFSANSDGACPDCRGLGVTFTDLAHLDPVASTCETCEGRRFTDEVLAHRLRELTIADVFDMTAADAVEAFTEKPIRSRAQALVDVGLGYVTLGQPASTLSGGERQRLKLATHLDGKPGVYVLDEPTTGLHMADVDGLVTLFHQMVDQGSSVIVIEHDLDVVAAADWVIDLGPGAGHDGGTLVFAGTPADLVDDDSSLTGTHLAQHIA